MIESMKVRLVGTWRTDRADEPSVRGYGDVSLCFASDGSLRYTIHSAAKDQIMLLTYRVDGECLVTDQPSSPHEHRTRFSLTADDRLALENPDGTTTYYVRGRG